MFTSRYQLCTFFFRFVATSIARGLNDGTASERYAYGLEVQEQSGFPGFVEVRWFWQDESGNAGLGVSGSGDVRAGITAGLLARGAEPAQAAVWAAFLHGRAGERLASSIGPLGFRFELVRNAYEGYGIYRAGISDQEKALPLSRVLSVASSFG